MINEDVSQEEKADDSVNEFRKAKEEMNRLGFDSFKEYQEYLEFKKMKQMQI